jgi:hypothetical protein
MVQHFRDWVVRIAPGLWPVVTLLIGIYVGGTVTSRNQRKQWVLDNKRNEFRELISAITRTVTLVANLPQGAGPEERKAAGDAELTAIAMINDRIFIAREMAELNVLNRWHKMMPGLVNRSQGSEDFDKLKEDLINTAMKLYE